MSSKIHSAPIWLKELQENFGNLIQTPLNPVSGKFEVEENKYSSYIINELKDNNHVDKYDGIKIYHTQYWYRIFNAMQKYYPRFSYIVGYWEFNHLVIKHIIKVPPNNYNLNEVINGFYFKIINALNIVSNDLEKNEKDFWVMSLRSYNLPIKMLKQAIQIDEAQLRSFKDKYYSNIDLNSKNDIYDFFSKTVKFSKSFGLVKEDWDLSLIDKSHVKKTIIKHRTPKYFVFYRTETSTAIENIEPLYAKFLSECSKNNIKTSIKNIERYCNNLELEKVNKKIIDWISIAIQKKWWRDFR